VRRGQLKRQRQPVQAAAERDKRARVRVGEREPWRNIVDTLHEELHGRVASELRDGGEGRGVGEGQRRHRDVRSAAHMQRHAADRQDRESGAVLTEVGQQWRGDGDALVVVEHEQAALVAQAIEGSVRQRRLVALAGGEHPRDRRGDGSGGRDGGEGNVGHAVGEGVARGVGRVQGKEGLADAAGTGQDEQAPRGIAQQRRERRALAFTSDGADERPGQSARGWEERGERHVRRGIKSGRIVGSGAWAAVA